MPTHMVKSAVRSFEILEVFAAARRPMRLRELTQLLNYPTSSVAALLKSMTAQEYLRYNTLDRTYIPTTRLAALLNWIPIDSPGGGVVFDAMRRVQRETKQLVVLGVPNDIYLEYAETLRCTEKGVQIHITPGTMRLMVQIGGGWLILSRRDEADAMRIYERTIQAGKLSPDEFTAEQFRERILEYRNTDVAVLRASDVLRPVEHWSGGMITVLVPSSVGRELTLGVGGPAHRLAERRDEIIDSLRRNAALLASASEAIGLGKIEEKHTS